MNLSLLDPFILAQDYPELLAGTLHSGHASCLRFNRKGDFLASGRLDGTVVVFDLETNGVARKLRGHRRQIQSLSWSRDGRYLLSSSQDWQCILWDLSTGSRLRTVRFEAPVYIAELHPTSHLHFVASLFEDVPVYVDMTSPIATKHVIPTTPLTDPPQAPASAASKDKHTTCVTIFTPTGSHIISGTSKGWLNVINTATLQTIHSTRISNSVIVLLRLSSSGRSLVANSTDRIIRTILLPAAFPSEPDLNLPIETEHKFQDVVNRLSWNHCSFSPHAGDYVLASTYQHHDLYVWERSHGSLVKILEGPREELGVVEWHPHRPFVAASGLESGQIYYWSISTPQRWSALAPDFAEVEENVEYEEKEDEFDIHPVDVIHKRRLDMEDEDVDVLTMPDALKKKVKREAKSGKEGAGTDAAAEEEDDEEFRMPVLLDISESESESEIVAVGPGTMRRKSPTEARGGGGGGGGGDEEAVGSGMDDGKGDKGKRSRKRRTAD